MPKMNFQQKTKEGSPVFECKDTTNKSQKQRYSIIKWTKYVEIRTKQSTYMKYLRLQSAQYHAM